MGQEGQVDHGPCKLEITTQNFHPATPTQVIGNCILQQAVVQFSATSEPVVLLYSSLLCITNTFTYSTELLLITVITTQLKLFSVGTKLGHNEWIATHALAHSKFSSLELAMHPTQSITLEVATGENLLTFCDIKDMELVSPPFTCIDNTLDERWSSLYGLCGYTVSAYGG